MLVNEKDFVLIPQDDNLDQNAFLEIYDQLPHFSITGKLSNPSIKSEVYSMSSVNSNDALKYAYNYARSLDNNFPEAYSYYVTTSILPLGFMEGAELKTLSENIKDEGLGQIVTGTVVAANIVGASGGSLAAGFTNPVIGN